MNTKLCAALAETFIIILLLKHVLLHAADLSAYCNSLHHFIHTFFFMSLCVCRWEEEYTARMDLQEKVAELEEVILLLHPIISNIHLTYLTLFSFFSPSSSSSFSLLPLHSNNIRNDELHPLCALWEM